MSETTHVHAPATKSWWGKLFWPIKLVIALFAILIVWIIICGIYISNNNNPKTLNPKKAPKENYSYDTDADCIKPGFYEYYLKEGETLSIGPVSKNNEFTPRYSEVPYILDSECQNPIKIYDGMKTPTIEDCRFFEFKAISNVHIAFNITIKQ